MEISYGKISSDRNGFLFVNGETDFTSVNCILGHRWCFIICLKNSFHSSVLLMSWTISFPFFLDSFSCCSSSANFPMKNGWQTKLMAIFKLFHTLQSAPQQPREDSWYRKSFLSHIREKFPSHFFTGL